MHLHVQSLNKDRKITKGHSSGIFISDHCSNFYL